jgi:hypothetical protein
MGDYRNTNHDLKEGGHFDGNGKNEMQHEIHMQGGGHYMLHDGGNSDLQKHTKAIYWTYGGQGHLLDTGGGLEDSHTHVPSRDYKDGAGHMKHSTDHTSNIGHGELMSGGHNPTLSGVRGEEIGNDYNHLEQGHGHVSIGGYGGVVGGDHSHTNIGLDNALSGGYGEEAGSGHSNTSHGYGQVLSEGHEDDIGGGQNHMDSGRDHVLSGSYGGDIGSGHSSMGFGNDDVLSGDYGRSIGVGHSHINYGDTYDSGGGFRGVIDSGHGNMKYVHGGDGYRVHENVSEDQASTNQTHGFDDDRSMEISYVIDPKTTKDHGGQGVEINGSHDLDGKEHKHLHKDESFVVRNSYGDVIQDFWHGNYNSKEKDHVSFDHSFEQNHVY